MILYPNPYL